MAKVIRVDFSKRGKDLRVMRKQRLAEKEFLKQEERIQRAIDYDKSREVNYCL